MSSRIVQNLPVLQESLAREGLQHIFTQPIPPHPEAGEHCPTLVQAYLKPGCPIIASVWLAPVPHFSFMVAYPPNGPTLERQDTMHALVSNYCPGDNFTILGLEWKHGQTVSVTALADTVIAVHRLVARLPIRPCFPELDLARLFPAWLSPVDVDETQLGVEQLKTVTDGDIWFLKGRKSAVKLA